MHCYGLDIGSSSIKGAILDLAQQRIGTTVSQPFPLPLAGLPSGWFEVAPEAIEQTTRDVFEALREAASNPAAVFVSGQMGGVLLIDDRGRAASNYLSWRDQRTREPIDKDIPALEELRNRWGPDLLTSLGNELQPGSTAALLFWLAQQGQLPDGVSFATVGDYVIGRLCERSPTMHVTQAIGMLDLQVRDWHLPALARLGLDGLRPPQLVHGIESHSTLRLGDRDVPVFGAYGDQQCALRGAGLKRGELSLNVSTGSQVSQRTDRFLPGSYQTRPDFDGEWLNTVTHLPAGRSLNVLVDLLTELAAAEGITLRDPWGELIRKAEAVAATDLQVDLAFFQGPLGSRGSIHGITTDNLTAGSLFHAAFRNMADNYARCAAWLDPQHSNSSVVVSGGLTKSVPLLRRMIADRFEQPIRETEGEETLLGLMELARSAVGSHIIA